MPNAKTIEAYLIGDENSFLLNKNNDGKVIMISGKWGCGKTYFWQEKIMRELDGKGKSHVYISLYGKDSLEAIQNEVFINIYNEKQKNRFDIIAKGYSIFSFLGKNFSLFGCNGEKFFNELDTLNKKMRTFEVEKHITEDGVICFDDFERKSTNIDLSDLFGFITQLALKLKCKVVIILNEEYFASKDAEIFSRVKEKTVNKFINFEPTKEELFEIIYKSNKKYENFNGSPKEIIFKSIEEADELNARIYFQILDNCLEYSKDKQGGGSLQLRTLVFVTIIFTKFNTIFNLPTRRIANYPRWVLSYPQLALEECINLPECLSIGFKYTLTDKDVLDENSFYMKMEAHLSDSIKTIPNGTVQMATPDEILKQYFTTFEENKKLLWLIYFYAYKLDFRKDVTDDDLKEISDFVKDGIIEKKPQN
ncbi:MAG: P-loop NTPase fold protein [bacterium]